MIGKAGYRSFDYLCKLSYLGKSKKQNCNWNDILNQVLKVKFNFNYCNKIPIVV